MSASRACCVLATTLLASAASAQEYGAKASVRRDGRGRELAASDFRIDVGELARVPRDNAQKLLTLAPGILLTNHGGEGHTASMYLRGFDAGEGEDLELGVEGIPLNEVSNHHGHGYADLGFVAPELVHDVRVVEGPFDPAQGDFAVAGSAELALGLARPGVQASARVGSFGRRRLFFGYRPSSERARTFASVVLERGDGFGPNRAFGNAAAVGQYDAKLAPRTFLRTLAFFSAQRWDSAGVVSERSYRARALPCASDEQFFCTHDPNQGGSGQRAGASTTLERTSDALSLRAQLFATTRGLRTRENFTGFTLDPRTDGGPQRGDLRAGSTQALTLGLRAGARAPFALFGRRHELALGGYARHDVVDTSMDRVRRELAVPYFNDFDRGVRQTNVALYAGVDLQLHERVRVLLGVRADAFAFSVLERAQPVQDRIGERLPHQAFDAYGFAASPRGTLELALLDELRWLLSVGQGARSSDATALSQSEAAPFARVSAAETGLGFTRAFASLQLEARSTLFFTRVSNDLVFDAEAGRNEPVGLSHRSGALLTARARLAQQLDVLGSATYTRAHLPAADTPVYEPFAGPRLPFVPTWLVRADGVTTHELPWWPDTRAFASVGVTYVGRRPLPLGQWAAPYSVLDLALGAGWRNVELSAALTNLLDTRFREAELYYVSNFAGPDAARSMTPSRHFSAGAPRQWMLTLSVSFEPALS
jgi:iron complex outermembrane receptor protein